MGQLTAKRVREIVKADTSIMRSTVEITEDRVREIVKELSLSYKDEWVRKIVKEELETVKSSMKTRKKHPSLLPNLSKKLLAQKNHKEGI